MATLNLQEAHDLVVRALGKSGANDAMAQAVCRRLLALAQESDAPITLLISSPGGHVESGDAIHDMIRFVRAPVNVVGTGWVASAGTHIYLSVPKERRVALPNTRFMIHQPLGGVQGRASDIRIEAEELLRAAVGALMRFGFVVLPVRVFAGLPVTVRRRLTEPSHRPTTIRYHIMRSVVHHSKIRCRLAAMGQNLRLPQRNIGIRFNPISRHYASSG